MLNPMIAGGPNMVDLHDVPEAVARRVVRDAEIAAAYAVDETSGVVAPEDFVVVRARDTADVVELLTHANRLGVPVVPQGARTGVTGGAVAIGGGYVLNVEALNSIEVVPEEGIVVAGAGAVLADVKQAAAAEGFFYPPDPSSAARCSIGGTVATNAGGLCCIKYGVTADYVRGLEVVLASGDVIRTGRRTVKGVAGLDLTGLFVGSEGTLGVVTEVVARLVPAPAAPETLVATFRSFDEAVAGVLALRAEPNLPSTLELMDRALLRILQEFGDFGYPDDCAAMLLVQSDRPGAAVDDMTRFAHLLSAAGAEDVLVADTKQEADALMEGRRAGQVALAAHGHHLLEDMCVPVHRLAEMIAAGYDVGERLGLEVTMSGHAGDGNLHPCVFVPSGAEGLDRAEQAVGELMEAALRLGGTITGEHGVGTFKRDWLPKELGEAEMARQRAVRALFDPRGILNPGRVHA